MSTDDIQVLSDSRAGNRPPGVLGPRQMECPLLAGIISCVGEPPPVSIETEIMLEQVKEHYQAIQAQLETKVNYYERELELLKRSLEKERKELEQAFRLEVSVLEGQKADLEARHVRSQEIIQGLQEQLRNVAHSRELERVEMEQYYARELTGLAQQLAQEKEQLKEELQLRRKEAEAELSQRLSWLETQQAAHCENLSLQHQREREAMLQKHWLQVRAMTEQLDLEKARREESEREILMRCKKQQLKQEELMSEEQAQICKAFALEKERLECMYREQVKMLAQEAGRLRALLEDGAVPGNRPDSAGGSRPLCLGERERQWSPAQLDPGEAREEEVAGDRLGQEPTEGRNVPGHQRLCADPLWTPAPVFTGLSESGLGLLNAEEAASIPSVLQSFMQTHGAAREGVLEKPVPPASGQANPSQPSSKQFQPKAQELLRLGTKGNGSPGTLGQEEAERAIVQGQAESLAKESALGVCTLESQPHCRAEAGKKGADPLDRGGQSNHEELTALRGQEEAALCLRMRRGKEVAEQRQEADTVLEKERNEMKTRLLQLEDIIRAIEKQTDSRENSRIKLCRLSEENTLLREELGRNQQELEAAERTNDAQRKEIEVLKRDKEQTCSEMEELNKQSQKYKDELSQLNHRVLQLGGEASAHQAQNKKNQVTIQLLTQSLEHASRKEEEQGEQIKKLEVELEHMNQECQSLRLSEAQLQETLAEKQDQLHRTSMQLSLAQSQHSQEVHQLQEQIEQLVPQDHMAELQHLLAEERQQVQQLCREHSFQAKEAQGRLETQKEEHEKQLKATEERIEEVEMILKNTEMLLQEKVDELKEQFEKNTKFHLLLKDLYVENAHLMKELQVTEEKQKGVEKKNLILEEKIRALNKLINKIASASLSV